MEERKERDQKQELCDLSPPLHVLFYKEGGIREAMRGIKGAHAMVCGCPTSACHLAR